MITTGASEVAISTSGHRLVQLKDICERITKGSTPTSYGFKYTTEGIRFIKAENIDKNGLASTTTDYIDEATNEFLKRSILQERDILFSIAGTIGRVGIIRRADLPANTNQALAIVRLQSGIIEQRYLFYYLKSDAIQKDALKRIVGVGRANLSLTNIGEFAIPLISLDKQKQIVAEIEKQFSRLDEALANLKRVKANLKRYKASVLKAAVEGKLTEAWRKQHPNVESGSKLLERILTERRAKWKVKGTYKEPIAPDTSNLSPLPQGWTWASVDQVAEVFLGKMLDQNKHRTGLRLPYLRNINVRWGRVRTEDLLEMFFESDELGRYGLKPGDVLVCEGGEPGRAAVWDGRIPALKYQKALHRVRFYGTIEPRYLVFLLEFLADTGRLERWFTGSTIKHFTRESFISLPIQMPSLKEQEEIVAEVEHRLSVIEELEAAVEANLTRADRLRQSVLGDAFSGKLVRGTV